MMSRRMKKSKVNSEVLTRDFKNIKLSRQKEAKRKNLINTLFMRK